VPYVETGSNCRHGWSQFVSGGVVGEQISYQVSLESVNRALSDR